MYLIYRHLLTAAAGPFIFGWFVITFLLMIDVLFRYVDLFVSKGVPFLLATKVLGLSLGHTFALSIPMAVLVAILMSVGQLATDHEITAMKASGISLWTVLRPLLWGAFVISVGLVAYNHYVFPESNHTLANLLFDISRKKPMLEIRPQQWTEMSDKMMIFVAEKNDKTGRIDDVQIFQKEKPGDLAPQITTATWGTIITDHETDSMVIELYDGETHERLDRKYPDKYQLIRFQRQTLRFENVERDFRESGRKTRGDREMNLTDLLAAAGEERGRVASVDTTVQKLSRTLWGWQAKVLDPILRNERLGTETTPPGEAARRDWLAGKFRLTRMQIDRYAEQATYQESIRNQYLVKENRYLVEFHKKFAIPFACVVFALLGIPMAVTASRSGKGVSVSLAILIYLIYYLFLVGGEKFADRGLVDPFLAMWAANIVLLAIGIPMFIKAARETSLINLTWRPGLTKNSDPEPAAGAPAP
jgi:lipopolysaccharide export system permease protein